MAYKSDQGRYTRMAAFWSLALLLFYGCYSFRDVVLGYFERERKDYKRIPLHEQVEVLSLGGNIALADGKPKLHAHVVIGKSDGSAHGGHLLEAHVWPTLEVMVVESPQHLRRTYDEETGLALLTLSSS